MPTDLRSVSMAPASSSLPIGEAAASATVEPAAPNIVTAIRVCIGNRRKAPAFMRKSKLPNGASGDDALVFAKWDGTPMSPNGTTTEWARALAQVKFQPVSLHALRYTHVSQLIASGMDVLTVSRRLGHGSPTITLGVYGHLFGSADDRAAQVIETAFGKVLSE